MSESLKIELHYDLSELAASPMDHVIELDSELDDHTSVLAAICEALQSENRVVFLVSGFGDPRWPVDVGTDLLSVLIQINDCLGRLVMLNAEFNLDFYEQGVERSLRFHSCNEESLRVACTSNLDWKPVPPEIAIDFRVLFKMLQSLKADFCQVAALVCPKLTQHKLFQQWKEEARGEAKGLH